MNLLENTGIITQIRKVKSKKTGKNMILIEYALSGAKEISTQWIYEDDANFAVIENSIDELQGAKIKNTLTIV